MDLVSVYRDAIALPTGAAVALVNEEIRRPRPDGRRRPRPRAALRPIGRIFEAREQIEFNVPPLLALEAMMISLQLPR